MTLNQGFDMTGLQETVKSHREKMTKLMEELVNESKESFSSISKQLFEKHPILENFSWRQYTPYFNDGDECTFHAQTDDPKFNGEDPWDGDLYKKLKSTNRVATGRQIVYRNGHGEPFKNFDGTDRMTAEYEDVTNEDYDPVIASAYNDLKTFLNAFDDDALKMMFGDHSEITVHRDGRVDVDEYEHE